MPNHHLCSREAHGSTARSAPIETTDRALQHRERAHIAGVADRFKPSEIGTYALGRNELSEPRQAAPSHIITRWVHVPLRFVTIAPMTVPGKGGRPRKWRSDADRVRAFRARARGEDEPPTIELALHYGDDAAAAWDQVRELGITIDALTAELKQTQATLRRAENELEREQARSSWLSKANDRLRIELDTAERERADLQAQLAELAQTTSTPAPNPRPAPGPNRAQRRQAERKRHRSP